MTTVKLHETVAYLVHPERPLLVSTLLFFTTFLRFLPSNWFGCARLLLPPPRPPVTAHRGARVPASAGRRDGAGALRVACCLLLAR